MFTGVIFFLLLCMPAQSGSEPECSSFHFVEKTLEKTIKTEIFVDKIKSEIEDEQISMNAKLNGLQNDLEETKQDLNTAKEETKNALDEIKGATHKIAFHSRNIKNTEPNNGETLIFTTTLFDEGSGYNNKTGVYTTPVAGVYMFNLQLCILSNRYFDFEIASGSGILLKGNIIDESSSYNGCHTATTVAVLDAKESVWIKSGSSSSGTDLWKNSYVWNSFTGALLSQ